MSTQKQKIAFQGEPGAYSHLACAEVYPHLEAMPCATFEDAFAALTSGEAQLGMIPIENSLAGRVADIHHLLPQSSLYIVAEHFLRIRHQLMGLKGAVLDDVNSVLSHTMALGQCRDVIRDLGILPVPWADTAGAARHISESSDKTQGAIASSLAAEIYGLDVLKADIEDALHNTTRFVVLSKTPDDAEPDDGPVITSFVFKVRNVPAALYKALGGFATNGVNMIKLESYQLEGSFRATQFYADIEGHPEERNVRLALEELQFFTSELNVLGIYKSDDYRKTMDDNF